MEKTERKELLKRFGSELKLCAQKEARELGVFIGGLVTRKLQVSYPAYLTYTSGKNFPSNKNFTAIVTAYPQLEKYRSLMGVSHEKLMSNKYSETVFSSKLRECVDREMKRTGCTLTALADAIGVSYSRLYAYLSGRARPLRKAADKLVEVFPELRPYTTYYMDYGSPVTPKPPLHQERMGHEPDDPREKTQGAVLIDWRKKFKHTRESLCKLTGIPIALMSDYENDKRILKLEHKAALEYLYRVKLIFPIGKRSSVKTVVRKAPFNQTPANAPKPAPKVEDKPSDGRSVLEKMDDLSKLQEALKLDLPGSARKAIQIEIEGMFK